jgi:hypothetical protein
VEKTTTTKEKPSIQETWTNGYDAWRKMGEDYVARMQSLEKEIQKVENVANELAKGAIDEGASVLKGMLSFSTQTAARFRERGIEATRRSIEACGEKETWKTFMESSVSRMQAIHDEIAKREGSCADEARAAIDQGTKIVKDSLSFMTKAQAEWRARAIETAKKVVETATR